MESSNIKYHSITKTFQNGKSSCFLACAESYLADVGIILSQQEMIDKLKPNNLCNEKGLVYNGKLTSAGRILGLSIEKVDYHFPINEKYEDNSLFISVNYDSVLPKTEVKESNKELHVVRYSYHLNNNEIIIMDPVGWFGLRLWNKQDLDRVYKEFFLVKLNKAN